MQLYKNNSFKLNILFLYHTLDFPLDTTRSLSIVLKRKSHHFFLLLKILVLLLFWYNPTSKISCQSVTKYPVTWLLLIYYEQAAFYCKNSSLNIRGLASFIKKIIVLLFGNLESFLNFFLLNVLAWAEHLISRLATCKYTFWQGFPKIGCLKSSNSWKSFKTKCQ